MTVSNGDGDGGAFVQSLERGLAVMRSFDGTHPSMTLTDVSKRTGLSRATVRRLLHTLVALGYVRVDGRQFELAPKVLDIGYAYVSSLQLPEIALPHMEDLSGRVHESVSAAVLDGQDIVYVARVPTQRIMAISLAIGSRLPALWTSMGRVLLAERSDDALHTFVTTQTATPPSIESIVDPNELVERIARVRTLGYCLLDQELEHGVRSIAVALRDRRGEAIGALNVGTHAARVTLRDLQRTILPELLRCAAAINAQLAKR